MSRVEKLVRSAEFSRKSNAEPKKEKKLQKKEEKTLMEIKSENATWGCRRNTAAWVLKQMFQF